MLHESNPMCYEPLAAVLMRSCDSTTAHTTCPIDHAAPLRVGIGRRITHVVRLPQTMDAVLPKLSEVNWCVLDTHPTGHSAPRQNVDGVWLARYSFEPHGTQVTFFDKENPSKEFAAWILMRPGLKEAALYGFTVSKSNHFVALPNWTPDFYWNQKREHLHFL